MTYTFKNEKGESENIPLEKWAWAVLYKNGTAIKQFGDDGIFHQIGEVKQEEVELFILYNTDLTGKRIIIKIPEGAKLIHKYRNFGFGFNTKNIRKERVYIFGYKKTASISHFNFILPDGRIIQSDTDTIKLTDFNI